MTIQVTGKNIGAGEAFRIYVTDKISDVLDKYIGPELSGHVRVEKSKIGFRTDCSLLLRTGLLVEAHGEGADAYASALKVITTALPSANCGQPASTNTLSRSRTRTSSMRWPTGR
jgi:ribosomal subunit interface protein